MSLQGRLLLFTERSAVRGIFLLQRPDSQSGASALKHPSSVFPKLFYAALALMLLYIKNGKVDQIAEGNKQEMAYKACDVRASLMVFRLLLFRRRRR